ncbi:hypothetical protein HGA91_01845 [candidate division WWE3 bacterium]|nr:hypothetical protein [candidate division WWE3 bacterium]
MATIRGRSLGRLKFAEVEELCPIRCVIHDQRVTRDQIVHPAPAEGRLINNRGFAYGELTSSVQGPFLVLNHPGLYKGTRMVHYGMHQQPLNFEAIEGYEILEGDVPSFDLGMLEPRPNRPADVRGWSLYAYLTERFGKHDAVLVTWHKPDGRLYDRGFWPTYFPVTPSGFDQIAARELLGESYVHNPYGQMPVSLIELLIGGQLEYVVPGNPIPGDVPATVQIWPKARRLERSDASVIWVQVSAHARMFDDMAPGAISLA